MNKEELFALMEQIAEEREAARPVVEQLVESGEPLEDIEIPEGWRTAGMVLELCEKATPVSAIELARALALQQLAITISSNLESSYTELAVQWLRGYTWNEIGYTQAEQTSYRAAFAAYDAGHRCLENEPAALYEQAKVKLRRAATLALVRRCDEAFRFASEAEALLSDFGDERRLLNASFTKALIDLYRNDFARARSGFESLIARADAIRYTDFVARLCTCLGVACRELRDFSAAVMYYQRSRALNSELGHVVVTGKIDWGLARVLLASGEFTKAEPILRELRNRFLEQQAAEDAGMVALDIVEILVATNRFAEARLLIEQVSCEFRNADLNHHLLTAIGYLRDVLSTTEHGREAVDRVRRYAENLKAEPVLLFLPLED